MFWKVLLLAVALLGVSVVDARNIARSGPSGSVNLVEVNVRGTTYGTCSFVNNGEEVSVTFEDKDGQVSARADNPTVIDAVSKAKDCRNAAANPPNYEPAFRTNLNTAVEESPENLEMRLTNLQHQMESNQAYVSELRPRFFFFMPPNMAMTFGKPNKQNKPQLFFLKPTRNFFFPFGKR